MEKLLEGNFPECLGPNCPNSCCANGSYIGYGELQEIYGGNCKEMPPGVDVYDARWDHLNGVGYRVKNCLGPHGCRFEEAGIPKPGICRTFPVEQDGTTGNYCPVGEQISTTFTKAAQKELKKLSRIEEAHPQPSC